MELKIGDRVKSKNFGSGYTLKLTTRPGYLMPGWTRELDRSFDNLLLIVLMTGLRLPLMWDLHNQEHDVKGENVYLDVLVQDQSGTIWLTTSEYLEKVE